MKYLKRYEDMKYLKLYEDFSHYSPIGVLDSGYGGAAILSASFNIYSNKKKCY